MAPRRVLAAALLGAVVAIVVIGASSRFDVDRMTFGDGVLHRYVAQHLTTSPDEVSRDLGAHGTAIRYSRVGLPVLLWALSGGNEEAMRYVQPLLMVLAAAAAAMAARMLFPNIPFSAAVPFAGIGFTLSLAGGFAEPVGVAFALWAVVCARRRRYWIAAGLLAGAMLTRENAAGIALAVVLWETFGRRFRTAAIMGLSIVPVAAWHLVLAVRFGFLPLRDPWMWSQTEAVGPPFVALVRSFTRTDLDGVILLHVLLAVVALLLVRTNVAATAAFFSGVQILWAGPDTWRFVGDAFRLMSFLEVFLIVAVLWWREDRRPEGRTPEASASGEWLG